MKKLYALSLALLMSFGALAQCDNIFIPGTATVFTAPSGSLATTLANIWVCGGGYPGLTGNYNIVYMEAGATLSIAGDSNIVYSKGENYMYINPGSDGNVVLHEGTGVNIANNGAGNTLLPCPVLTYNYTSAPSPGCAGVGISESATNPGIMLSPTVVEDLLTFRIEGSLNVKGASILDMYGHEVRQLTGNLTLPLDISGLRAGSYLVRVLSDHGPTVHRFVKL